MIALIDYGAGNLASVRKALAAVGAEWFTPSAPADLARASAIVLPGVGHFGATAALGAAWRETIRRRLEAGTPFLGICLGMQWLFEGSAEAPEVPGLGWFPGTISRLDDASWRPASLDVARDRSAGRDPGLSWRPASAGRDPGLSWRPASAGRDPSRIKIPHVGWNTVHAVPGRAPLAGLADGASYYFTHAYAAPVTDAAVAVTEHGTMFASAVRAGHVCGVQFHPEKSGAAGLALLGVGVGISAAGAVVTTTGLDKPGPVTTIPEDRSSARKASGPQVAPQVARRLIACLDVRDGRVVKGVQFEGLRDAGDPAALAARYNDEGIDELVVLDVTATVEGRLAMARTIAAIAARLFIPLTVGGGIRSLDDATRVIEAGADKVGINTAALADPGLITRVSERFGSQAVVVAIDARRADGRFEVCSHSGRTPTAREAVAWAQEAEARGAGEILLTSIDADGTLGGFDCPLTAAVSDAVSIPVIASGGAGAPGHFAEVFSVGHADAALAASIFHDRACSVRSVKASLRACGVPVRW